MENENKLWNPPRIGEKLENEVVVYTVAVGNLPVFAKKKTRKALRFIKGLDGFIGVYPYYPHGTLCFFRTLNQAKIAKNMMDAQGIATGFNITEAFIDKKYVEGING